MEHKIIVKNARLSFPRLFRAEGMIDENGNEGKKKFSCQLLLDADDPQIKAIEKEIEKVKDEKWGKGKHPKNMKQMCLKDGDDFDFETHVGMKVITASESRRPGVCNRDKTPVAEEDDVIYAGCYVNAVIVLWAQDNKWGKGVNAGLKAVQFAKDGEAFGADPVDMDEEFDDLSDMDEDDEDCL